MQEIHEKVMLLDFDEAITEIWSVDCQHSASQGVLVQVAGSLQCKVSATILGHLLIALPCLVTDIADLCLVPFM